MKNKKFVCIHGHFYQPPRENPWLEDIETQPSASPFHDWNERVNSECYAPNTAARILNNAAQIIEILNNYEFISFNFGPTLLDWLAKHNPRTVEELQAADKKSLARLGHGNAIAQVYNHIIMPLANRQDKITQVKWGIANFEKYFARKPEGMWLAEAAVDLETLDVLAAEGIKFTILAPGQAAAARASNYSPWQDMRGGRIDPKRPYFVTLPSGGRLALFFYDGPLSQAIAFEGVLNDGAVFANRVRDALDKFPAEAQLANMATDGESYGHHHRFGEMALAYALQALHKDPTTTLSNYAAFLADNPPTWEAQIVERSSWSCAHGVERWRSDCGCGGHGQGWSLAWRAPLRKAFDELRDDISGLMETYGRELFKDPYQARNDYINFLQGPATIEAIHDFLRRNQAKELNQLEAHTAMKLMECSRYSMYTFTSCGWFFDDIAGLEPIQNMRYAARAIELAESIKSGSYQRKLLATLETAISNQRTEGTGLDIWRRHVWGDWIKPEQLVIEAVLPSIVNRTTVDSNFHCYAVESDWSEQAKHLSMRLFGGALSFRHHHLLLQHKFSYIIFYVPETEPVCIVSPWSESSDDKANWKYFYALLQDANAHQLRAVLTNAHGYKRVDPTQLAEETRSMLAKAAFGTVLNNYRKSITSIYDEAREAMRIFREMNLPLPRIFLTLAEIVTVDQLMSSLESLTTGDPIPHKLNQLAMQAKAMGVMVSNYSALQLAFESLLERETDNLYLHRAQNDPSRIELVNNLLDLAQAFSIKPNLWRAQNTVHLLVDSLSPGTIPEKMKPLVARLGFAPEMLSANNQ